MTYSECLETYGKAIETYGKQAQEWMIIEEMSELTKEICKHQRGKDNRDAILEEIADVSIMIDQALLIYDISEYELGDMIEKKAKRLRNRLEEANGNGGVNRKDA